MFDPEVWATFNYRATILNDGANSGNHDYLFEPGEGGIMGEITGQILNGDAAGRTITIQTRDADDNISRQWLGNTVGSNTRRQFPTSQTSGDNGLSSSPPAPWAAGSMDFFIRIASVAVSENTEVSLACLVLELPPTVTLTSPTGATETETENRIV